VDAHAEALQQGAEGVVLALGAGEVDGAEEAVGRVVVGA
jgi:hypothetical protein